MIGFVILGLIGVWFFVILLMMFFTGLFYDEDVDEERLVFEVMVEDIEISERSREIERI